MQLRRSPSVRPLDTDWHRGRQYARENYFNESMASGVERVKYELDTVDITGEWVDRTYTVDRPIDLFGENGLDIRNLEDR